MTVTRHDMPAGTTVYYKDADHSYWREHKGEGKCAGRIPGISTIAKNDGDTSTDGLLDWAARLTCEGVAEVAGTELNEEWLARGDTIQAKLRDNEATWRQLRDSAGVRGSITHDVLQNLSEGVTPALRSGYDHAAVDWWKKHRPESELVEQVVYSPVGGFAGRFDLMASWGGVRTLLDLKTSKWISNSFAVQLNLYRLAAVESGFPAPDQLMILQVRPDGNWAEIVVPIRPDWAMDALKVYEHGREIRKALKDGRVVQPERRAVAA